MDCESSRYVNCRCTHRKGSGSCISTHGSATDSPGGKGITRSSRSLQGNGLTLFYKIAGVNGAAIDFHSERAACAGLGKGHGIGNNRMIGNCKICSCPNLYLFCSTVLGNSTNSSDYITDFTSCIAVIGINDIRVIITIRNRNILIVNCSNLKSGYLHIGILIVVIIADESRKSYALRSHN